MLDDAVRGAMKANAVEFLTCMIVDDGRKRTKRELKSW